jgi:hypothetical protein
MLLAPCSLAVPELRVADDDCVNMISLLRDLRGNPGTG